MMVEKIEHEERDTKEKENKHPRRLHFPPVLPSFIALLLPQTLFHSPSLHLALSPPQPPSLTYSVGWARRFIASLGFLSDCYQLVSLVTSGPDSGGILILKGDRGETTGKGEEGKRQR